MTLDDEIALMKEQEEALQFREFSADTAWELGCRLRELAMAASKPVAMGVWMAGQTMFYAGTNGITADNEDWLRRKRNTVLRFSKSSLRVGAELAKRESSLESKQGLLLADFATHGGGFPILLRGSGCVGVIGVSGLPQREDHGLVVRALSEILRISVASLL